MEKYLRIIDGISEWTGKIASYIMAALVVAICYDITVRYLFSTANIWPFDITYMAYGAYTMLGVAYCHYHKGHVRMDLLYGRLSTRGKATMDVICYIFLFFPLLMVLTYKCGQQTLWSILHSERSSSSVWRPLLGPFNAAIELGFILFLLQGIADFLRTLRTAVKGESNES